jgi:phosphoglycerate dehydrogenase-like enzyme
VISSWGTPRFDEAVMPGAPNLRLLCHAAGSVKPVVSPALWSRGVEVVSSAAALGTGVAEYCLGLMLTASKRVFWLARDVREGKWREGMDAQGPFFELHRQGVGVIGASHVGRQLIHLLGNLSCDVLLYDPYCSAEEATRIGARKVDTLEQLFEQSRVVSLNAPVTKETIGMVRGHHFACFREGSIFINTARADLVNEDEFIDELHKGHFIACVDVTKPEPCPADHPFRSLPNVLVTPHIAGAVRENRLRIGALVRGEIERFAAGLPLQHSLVESQLGRIG